MRISIAPIIAVGLAFLSGCTTSTVIVSQSPKPFALSNVMRKSAQKPSLSIVVQREPNTEVIDEKLISKLKKNSRRLFESEGCFSRISVGVHPTDSDYVINMSIAEHYHEYSGLYGSDTTDVTFRILCLCSASITPSVFSSYDCEYVMTYTDKEMSLTSTALYRRKRWYGILSWLSYPFMAPLARSPADKTIIQSLTNDIIHQGGFSKLVTDLTQSSGNVSITAKP